MVIFETVFILQSFDRMPRADIAERLDAIIRMRGLHLANKRVYLPALDLYAAHPFLSFADAFNAAFIQDGGLDEIYAAPVPSIPCVPLPPARTVFLARCPTEHTARTFTTESVRRLSRNQP